LLNKAFNYWDNKVDYIASYWANSIRNNNPDASSFAVLYFSIFTFTNYAIIILLIIVVAILTGDILEAGIALISFPILRYFSGGIHLESSTKCVAISVFIVFVCIYMPVSYWYTGIVLNIVSAVLLALFAPSGIKQSRIKKEQYPLLKLIAVVIVGSNFFFHSPVLSMAFFAQSITTIPIFREWLERQKW
jgi:accessory gene regulator B